MGKNPQKKSGLDLSIFQRKNSDPRLETMSAVDIPPDFETYQARQKNPWNT